MSAPLIDLSNARSDSINKTVLGKICGSTQRFRDRYEVLKVLGRGGFGITFLAKDVYLPGEPLCVIKQLCPKVSDNLVLHRARQRFEQEAKMLSKLGSHAQIPQLLDYFEKDGEFYLIQDYIRGNTLTRELRRSGPFSEIVVKQFLRELLPLLQYIHNNRVIHRDIKPPNIIRCKDDGRLVLIDFGAVKEQLVASDRSSCKPSTTQFVGTVGFAPPEQLASRPLYSSDLYAVGVTCLYLLSGKSPLEFEYEFGTGDVRWQDHITVSKHFGTVLTKLLKSSPNDRFHSASEVLRALDLEPYLDNLMYCMNIKPKPFLNANLANDTEFEGYVPPLVRRAIAIRDWRTRLRARQMRLDYLQPKVSYSNGSSR
ncbi:serine/threonine protein kinase [Leptolyngbya sp. FACHB-36]|uniref:serine/threonine-protein kinase n=1 Tax=Leptolyngbya sp. FACHB-36 TaxID=2692808 RepID=UPI0016812AF9|nr:serine/threonine-protein kinase [Leptolyngbya sp. FACHB-36]MBD2019435.1 serine/threonine protein kinase [Leptolyngbya sp. FACHB-36]